MNEAQEAIQQAEARQAAREAAYKPINYAEMNRIFPRQKAALTRAIKSGDRDKLILAIRDAVRAWNKIGAWPDDWARWQRALDDYRPPGDDWSPYYPIVDIRDLA
jgi:hypothetical protein